MSQLTLEIEAEDWLRLVKPGIAARLGRIRHVLFDFDGTLSLLRQGWEEVMVPLMVEAMCAGGPPEPGIEVEVRAFVDRSTGILTMRQMEWLVEAVRRHPLAGAPKSAPEYKKIYLERLEQRIKDRRQAVMDGLEAPETCMVPGAVDFVRGLAGRGVSLYLASGSDHADVVREAAVLGLGTYFEGGIYGALDGDESNAKERVIQSLLDSHALSGSQLLVVGDGPVEIREAVARQAIALGVASDEVARTGWNERKVDRLTAAGADVLVADFRQSDRLVEILVGA
jgi:phosphoglycolate phosphatase